MSEFGSLFGMMNAIGMGAAPRIAKTEVEVEGGTLIVSTIDSWDMGPETAIIDAVTTYIVERYPSVMAAEVGHNKWELFAKTAKEVKDVGYGELVEEKTVTLVPR
jgi:hypothetical protein